MKEIHLFDLPEELYVKLKICRRIIYVPTDKGIRLYSDFEGRGEK